MSSVDVIVPCYRYAHFLCECVQSILRQPIEDLRVLIIDDASPDNTADVAADLALADSRITFIRHSLNKGHIATYNEGIEWATADYMLILSADDYLLDGALKRAVDLMDGHPEVGFSFGNAIEVDQSRRQQFTGGVPGAARAVIFSGPEFIQRSGARNIVPTPTAIVRTELQKLVGGYSPELPHSGDMEMWLRLAAHAPVGFISAYQAVYRRHSNNMSLEYMTRGQLPDLEQRRSALKYFFQTCGHLLPNCRQLRSRSFSALARRAVACASTAFNEGQMDLSRQLSTFALHVYPRTDCSWPWTKLVAKRVLGFSLWRMLQPSITTLREMSSRDF